MSCNWGRKEGGCGRRRVMAILREGGCWRKVEGGVGERGWERVGEVVGAAGKHAFFFVTSLIARDLSRSWQYTHSYARAPATTDPP